MRQSAFASVARRGAPQTAHGPPRVRAAGVPVRRCRVCVPLDFPLTDSEKANVHLIP